MNGGTNGVAVSSSGFASLVRQTNPSVNSSANVDTFTCAGQLSHFTVVSSAPPSLGAEYFGRVFVNGGETALSCFIDTDTTCTNASFKLDVNPGDEINVAVSPSADAASFTWSAAVNPPAAVYP